MIVTPGCGQRIVSARTRPTSNRQRARRENELGWRLSKKKSLIAVGAALSVYEGVYCLEV